VKARFAHTPPHGVSAQISQKSRDSDRKAFMMLLKHGADVDAVTEDGLRHLYWPVVFGNSDAVKILLEHGADPKKQIPGVPVLPW
jgi:ankyrin repeat protein